MDQLAPSDVKDIMAYLAFKKQQEENPVKEEKTPTKRGSQLLGAAAEGSADEIEVDYKQPLKVQRTTRTLMVSPRQQTNQKVNSLLKLRANEIEIEVTMKVTRQDSWAAVKFPLDFDGSAFPSNIFTEVNRVPDEDPGKSALVSMLMADDLKARIKSCLHCNRDLSSL